MVEVDMVSESSGQRTLAPFLNSVAAHLFVRDIHASIEFFQTKLGFSVDFVYGDPAFYAQVSRDNVKFAMRHMDEPVFIEGIREREDLVVASITVATAEEINHLFFTYQAADVPVHHTLKKEPWDALTFTVKDPDGNLILFAGPASER